MAETKKTSTAKPTVKKSTEEQKTLTTATNGKATTKVTTAKTAETKSEKQTAKKNTATKSATAKTADTSTAVKADTATVAKPTTKKTVAKTESGSKRTVSKPTESVSKSTATADKTVKSSTAKTASGKAEKNTKRSESKTANATVKGSTTAKKARKKVLFVGSEAFPFAGTGGLGEVLGSLPRAINDGEEYEARVILPLYGSFPQDRRKDLEFVCDMRIWLSWRNLYCGLFRIKEGNTTFYFVDNEYYFKRDKLYGYGDDGERFAFFSKAVLDLLPMLDFFPDVLHCNDWQTALVPVYYNLFYRYGAENYGNIRTIFTIHNIEYQGWFNRDMLTDIFGIPDYEFGSVEHFGEINLMKAAIDYSDAVGTVSPTYAKEILTREYGHTLDGDLIRNEYKLRGILNGVDTIGYNPELNPALFAHYSADDKSGKRICKQELQKMLGLPVSPSTPIIAMITRLADHKGLDIVRDALPEIIKRGVQFVLLGTGDSGYERYFTDMQNAYPDSVRAVIAFDKTLSHRIYSGADIFLMPSRSEPCGLSQMMAARYGTIPIVRETGGLADSIVDAYNGDFGNGYRFARYAADDLINAVDRAVGLYIDYPDKFSGLMDRAMRTDFSWNVSAKAYEKFFDDVLNMER